MRRSDAAMQVTYLTIQVGLVRTKPHCCGGGGDGDGTFEHNI